MISHAILLILKINNKFYSFFQDVNETVVPCEASICRQMMGKKSLTSADAADLVATFKQSNWLFAFSSVTSKDWVISDRNENVSNRIFSNPTSPSDSRQPHKLHSGKGSFTNDVILLEYFSTLLYQSFK